MADIGKRGYSYTGHTEGFIVPPGYSATTATLSSQNFGVNGIDAAVPIEYSEWKNSGLYVRPNITGTVNSFTSTDTNIHVNPAKNATQVLFADSGKFIISDNFEPGVVELNASNNVTINSITYTPPTYGDVAGHPHADSSEKGVYTFNLSGNVTITAGMVFRVVARKLDVGTSFGVATPAGQLCVAEYTPIEYTS